MCIRDRKKMLTLAVSTAAYGWVLHQAYFLMCTALKREPHVKNHPPSIRETLAHYSNECAQLECENHILKTTRPQS
eukprot:2490084-Pyramimonas_sp.AAC.1